jgi:hypothetical protein
MNQIVAEKSYISQKLGIAYENLSQSYLRSITQLSTNSVVSFSIQKNQVATPKVTENLLELNDIFVATHIAVGLQQVAGTDTPSNLQYLTAEFCTYDDPRIFTGTNAANVGAIYGGALSFTVDRREVLPSFPMRAFYRAPQTQTGAFLSTGGTVASPVATFTGNTGVNGYDNGLYGFYVLDPIALNGRQTINIDINLGAAIAFDDTSNSVFSFLELRGYLVVNAKN